MTQQASPGKKTTAADPWWFPLPCEGLAPTQERFYGVVAQKQAELQASQFGQIMGKPTLGNDSYTTMQTNRWKREVAS